MCRTRSEHKSIRCVTLCIEYSICASCAHCAVVNILRIVCFLHILHLVPTVQFVHIFNIVHIVQFTMYYTCCTLCSILCTLCCSGICVVHYVLCAHRVHHCTLCGCPINYTCYSGINQRLQGFKVSDQAKRNQSKAFYIFQSAKGRGKKKL